MVELRSWADNKRLVFSIGSSKVTSHKIFLQHGSVGSGIWTHLSDVLGVVGGQRALQDIFPAISHVHVSSQVLLKVSPRLYVRLLKVQISNGSVSA